MGYIEELRALIGHKRINLCGSVVIVRNAAGRILMQQRAYPHGKWGLPGGMMELGESTEETARRELLKEAGLTLGKLTLVGVYSGREYLCIAANGDEFYTVVTAYRTDEYEGVPSVRDEESLTFEWIDPTDLPENIVASHHRILNDFLEKNK